VAIIPDEIYATDDISLPEYCARLLTEKNLSVATAESCTGGSIAAALTAVPGSSAFFKGSIIAYANDIKEQELKVPTQLLIDHGAVSQQVAEKMAEQIRAKMQTSLGIAVTGIAGPTGGTSEKPVGTTWIAIADANGCLSRKFSFGEHRGRNVEKSIQSALNMLRIRILAK